MNAIKLQFETTLAAAKIDPNTISEQSHKLGLMHGEPLLYGIDGLLRYAKAYKLRYEQPLSEDGVLGEPWLQAAKGFRALCNGDGAVAYERGITTDSKDNGVIESVFWAALEAAGYTEGDI